MIVRAEHEGDAYEPADDAMERMEKSVTSCEQELLGIRTGASADALGRAFASSTALNKLATLQALHWLRTRTPLTADFVTPFKW